MLAAQPVVAPWTARLGLEFSCVGKKTILSEKRFEGPLVVQKPLYPEGEKVCHAIVVHPPAGIAGGDELFLQVRSKPGTCVLMTTPGAGKWYRSAGPQAKQSLSFDVAGVLEWLPRETIVFDGAIAALECDVRLRRDARYIGWEVLCLGRTGSGERFGKGEIRIDSRISRDGKPLWLERGRIPAGGALMRSAAGLAGRAVFGTLVAASTSIQKESLLMCREKSAHGVAITLLPGLLIARYLGDSSEEAMQRFSRLWEVLRPSIAGREAVHPRIWST